SRSAAALSEVIRSAVPMPITASPTICTAAWKRRASCSSIATSAAWRAVQVFSQRHAARDLGMAPTNGARADLPEQFFQHHVVERFDQVLTKAGLFSTQAIGFTTPAC